MTHADFIFVSYAVTFVVLLAVLTASLYGHHQVQRRLKEHGVDPDSADRGDKR